ncbi:hypothetical protein GALL_546770 [mine drainage metagenome]|uniref:Uncharacterized protein n=1 Tax=mine drainage metagenome TaxID=410659 RepID=A0A1J5P8J4_9ZZZZ
MGDPGNDITWFHAPQGCRSVLQYAGDDDSLLRGNTEGLCQLSRDFIGFDPNPAACHMTFVDDALKHHFGC